MIPKSKQIQNQTTTKTNKVVDCSSTSVKEGKGIDPETFIRIFNSVLHYFEEAHEPTERV